MDPTALAGNIATGIALLHHHDGKAKTVLLGRGDAAYLAHLAIQLELGGVFHEADSLEKVHAGLRLVLAGGVCLSARVDEPKRALFSRVLSEREVAIMAELAAGTPNERLARRLRISVETVRTHRRNVMRKVTYHHLPAGFKVLGADFGSSNAVAVCYQTQLDTTELNSSQINRLFIAR